MQCIGTRCEYKYVDYKYVHYASHCELHNIRFAKPRLSQENTQGGLLYLFCYLTEEPMLPHQTDPVTLVSSSRNLFSIGLDIGLPTLSEIHIHTRLYMFYMHIWTMGHIVYLQLEMRSLKS